MKKLIAIFAILALLSCKSERESNLPGAKELIKSFTLTEAHGDRLMWEMKGKTAINRGDTIVVMSVEIEFFNEENESKSILTADSGYVFMNSNNLKAIGNVVIKSSDSITLWTDELNWDEQLRKVRTDSYVKYRKDNKIYEGIGLESDPNLKHIIIKKEFRGKGEFE